MPGSDGFPTRCPPRQPDSSRYWDHTSRGLKETPSAASPLSGCSHSQGTENHLALPRCHADDARDASDGACSTCEKALARTLSQTRPGATRHHYLPTSCWGNYLLLIYGELLYLPHMRRTTIWLADSDREAIQTVRERFGASSDSDAIRLAVRTLARAERLALWPMPEQSDSEQEEGDE
jgi:hypothetical protein